MSQDSRSFAVSSGDASPGRGTRAASTWHAAGYRDGARFARQEADFDELAAISRQGGIPLNWDIFRAEILNRHLGESRFDFAAYAAGFARACTDFFEEI
jgi:hypothetical protein